MSDCFTRRTFLRQTGATVALLGVSGLKVALAAEKPRISARQLPWYRRTLRWGQTNITEADPPRYDIHWWRGYWKRTRTQGVVVNAGGIVAYYPSRVLFHRPAQFLNGRDLFGGLCRAAHEDGLVVFARMDSNRAHEDLYRAHPDWFAVDADGRPHRAGELYVACVNGPYYEQHLPAVLREICELYHPEGFTDNSWAGLGRSSPCFCENCQKRFKDRTGQSLPRTKNWNDSVYREWIGWNYQRRTELWDFNNSVTRAAGGPDCIWVGMNSGSIPGQCQSFRDYREICRRAEMIMLDHQSRGDSTGFQHNGETGKLIHGLLGWDKLIPESMAMYQAGRPTFRVASKPAAEARMWMIDGIAGGLQPWWHHVGAYHEDRRMYHTAEPVTRWHEQNQEFLINRKPVATVGVVWSQQNTDFFGRDDADLFVELPFRGFAQALIRARIPYLPIHADELETRAGDFELLILPNLGAVSDAQVKALRAHVQRGGGLLATGQSTLFTEFGDPRPDYALADVFGAHLTNSSRLLEENTRRRWASDTSHSYLRLLPELRAEVDGPQVGSEPKPQGRRHPVLEGFSETDIFPFGGVLEDMKVDPGTQVLATFVPSFPIYPPETAWMRQPKTDIPALLVNARDGQGRVAFLPADIDRRFARDNLPDQGNLLANLVRWTGNDRIPLHVEGRGLIDCHLYRQDRRFILHLVNLTSAGSWRQPVDELIPVGPLHIKVKLAQDMPAKGLRLLVSGKTARVTRSGGWCSFTVDSVLDHEVAVLS